MSVADSTTASEAAVYLHIGLPKTGTSSIQSLLWDSRDRLARHGVLVPGDRRPAQHFAVWDLMGRRPRGGDLPHLPGSWEVLVDQVRAWSGSHAIISEEFLAFARPGQVRQAIRAFAPAQVHVVVTLRDLARVIVGTWQQGLAKGHAWTWEEYAAAVRHPERGPASAGVAFWLRQDVVRVLDTWEAMVPRERIHLVTVPQPGAPWELLTERFAAATRLEPAWLEDSSPERGNVSVGTAEAEVLRRLNLALGNRLNERQYTRAVSHGVRPALQDRPDARRMGLPEEHREWVTERAGSMVNELRHRGYDVVGDLNDMLPGSGSSGEARPDETHPEAVAEAALSALAAVVEQYATFWWRFRSRDRPAAAGEGPRLASGFRAVVGRARMSAFDLADRNRLVRAVATRYLRR